MADARQKFVNNKAVMLELRCTDGVQHMDAFGAFGLYGQAVVG
jgi:hypothetical protein